MTLRNQLAMRYLTVALTCTILLSGLLHHELVTEPRERQDPRRPRAGRIHWSDYAEVFFYSAIPLVFGGGWWLLRKTLAPVDQLAHDVERIGADNLRAALPRSGNGDELDRLTVAFNAMTVRVDQAFQQIREFTLHASHELKTPLTVMRAELETALRDDGTLSPAQRDRMHSQLEELQRLGKIVDGLTMLTKAEAGELTLDLRPIPLAELVRESFDDAVVMAEPQQVRVSLGACADAVVLGDRHRLRQMLLNLVDNAIKYNEPGGTVTLALRQTADAAVVEITNSGPGIPADLQPRVFDRFVRGPEARRQAADGCGLGLSIVQWIVQAHGGTVRLVSEPGRLTTATVRLPLAAASHPAATPAATG